MSTVVAYAPDLMDRSKLAAVLDGIVFVTRPADVAGAVAEHGAEVAVLDLGRAGVAEVLPAVVATGARVVGYGSHVERATLQAATAAGCEAMPRSQFFRSLGDLRTP